MSFIFVSFIQKKYIYIYTLSFFRAPMQKWLTLLVSAFLDSTSYVYFVNSCKVTQHLKKRAHAQNSVFERIRIYQQVFDRRRNVFITGPAGTGKSTLLNKIYEIAIDRDFAPIMTATTGGACCQLIHSQTIHSFSGLHKGTIPFDVLVESLKEEKFCRRLGRWRNITLLIIDEISMLGESFFEKLNLVAGTMRHNKNSPFGNLQVVYSGDFLQLPPVADHFCFESKTWEDFKFANMELTVPFRQSQDLPYFKFLQRIRIARPFKSDILMLEENVKMTASVSFEDFKIKPTHLFTRTKDVRKKNTDEFNKLTTLIEHQNLAEDSLVERYTVIIEGKNVTKLRPYVGDFTTNEAVAAIGDRLEHAAPRMIEFKDGAQFILTTNYNVQRRLVNGSRLVYLSGGRAEFKSGDIEHIDKFLRTFTFPVPGRPNLFLNRRQYSFRLGYAATIHSSQGMSLDCACIDLGKPFGCSLAYVALSRVRSFRDLYLLAFNVDSIKIHQKAEKFMKKISSNQTH
jgi:ATP-dependent DNA helicase PIF1